MKKLVLITCPKCGHMITGRLWRCPECGDHDTSHQTGKVRKMPHISWNRIIAALRMRAKKVA